MTYVLGDGEDVLPNGETDGGGQESGVIQNILRYHLLAQLVKECKELRDFFSTQVTYVLKWRSGGEIFQRNGRDK